MNNFFEAGEVPRNRVPLSLLPKCGSCGLLKTCQSPKMKVDGEGRKKILIVGDFPGENDDLRGKPFVGKAGIFLREQLLRVGIRLRKDCWITNALICRPPHNRIPKEDMIDWCRPNLIATLEELKPEVVLVLGGVAIKSLLGWLWKEKSGDMTRWVGWSIPSQKLNAWVCPTYHPSYLQGEDNPVLNLMFQQHLEQMSDQVGKRPYKEVPNYKSRVAIILNHQEAAQRIRDMVNRGGRVTFDYETDRLKPDPPEGAIICCSVCWEGKETIAFPWVGDVPKAMKELLTSDLEKYGANIKFETRWTRRKLGVNVRNWKWDCMNMAHVLDNRTGVTSVKFQAFVRLGLPSYDEHIDPYKGGKGGNAPNKLRQVPLHDLLLYCGIDSLVEFKIAVKQMKEFRSLLQ